MTQIPSVLAPIATSVTSGKQKRAAMKNWSANNQGPNQFAVVQVATVGELHTELDCASLNWLSDCELARYQSITSSNRKQQFLAGHFLIRKMASRVFTNLPHDLTYYRDAQNLRRLKCNMTAQPELYVSISHSGDWIAAAVSHAPIGIDIETFSKQRDFIAIANHVFSAAEISCLESCCNAELKETFYLYWTLKESAAKQYGVGLNFEISRSQSPVLVFGLEQADLQTWQCQHYVIAVASKVSTQIETHGLNQSAKHQAWKNIRSSSCRIV